MQAEKLLTEMLMTESSEDMFFQKSMGKSMLVSLVPKVRKKHKTMTDCVKYLSIANNIERNLSGVYFGAGNLKLNDELSNSKVRYIAQELAVALDENSVEKIKQLKAKFGNDKEFLVAKKFLNEKCEEIWNVFENKNSILNLPKEAMKTLGITNQPTLDFLLGNSIRYYEKDGGNTTAGTISSILNNKNLDYTIKDIHKFLKTTAAKEKLKFNLNTVKYLILEQNYTKFNLQDLGIEQKIISEAVRNISFNNKFKYYLRNLYSKIRA